MIPGSLARRLREAGMNDEDEEFSRRVASSGSRDEALQLAYEYVEVALRRRIVQSV
jgi:hypothetical protein